MTDPAIIEASYAAEHNYSHNLDDIIDASGAVLAIGTEKVDTTTLKDRSPEDNNANIHGAMPTEGFIQGRRFTAANENYLDCGNDSSLDIIDAITIGLLFKTTYDSPGEFHVHKKGDNHYLYGIRQNSNNTFALNINLVNSGTHSVATADVYNDGILHYIEGTFDGRYIKIYIDGRLDKTQDIGTTDTIKTNNLNVYIGASYFGIPTRYFEGSIVSAYINGHTRLAGKIKQNFNTLACLPFWSVNYTDYPDNVTEYINNLPYSSSIISSGTFKVDDDKLQCVSAGTMTYSASYEFDGSEYIKVEIGGVEYAGTGTITQGNTTVSIAQGSNKITIEMGTGDTIDGDGIDIQFREEV